MFDRKRPIIFIFPVIALIFFVLGIYHLLNPSIEIQWSTATEIDTLGFNVFRGDTKEGPFLKQINTTLVLPKGDMLTGGQYKLSDNEVRAGRTYYYLLQELQMGGKTEDFGPIAAKVNSYGWLEMAISMLIFLGYLFIRKKSSDKNIETSPACSH